VSREPTNPQSKTRVTADAALASGGTNSRNMERFAIEGVIAHVTQAKSILDLGCGTGELGMALRQSFRGRVDGMDVVRHPGFKEAAYDSFTALDLDIPGEAQTGERYDIVFAVEVIEHLENPRAFVRFAAGCLKPGGYLVVTTVNVVSVVSLGTLIFQGAFREFRDGLGNYPAHITPLLPIDAVRVLRETGLEDVELAFTNRGTVPYGARTIQSILPLKGQWVSDNYRVVGRRAT
jgi:SAM-dependent methyltransferase